MNSATNSAPTTKMGGPITWILVLLFLLGLVCLLFYSVFGGMYSSYVLNKRGNMTSATVMKAHCDKGNRSIHACRVQVSFFDTTSRPVTTNLDVTRSLVNAVKPGQSLPVMYDPQKPIRARVALSEYDKPFWKKELGVIGTVIAFLIILGLVVSLVKKLKRRKV